MAFCCLRATEHIDPVLELTVGQFVMKVASFFLLNPLEGSLTPDAQCYITYCVFGCAVFR